MDHRALRSSVYSLVSKVATLHPILNITTRGYLSIEFKKYRSLSIEKVCLKLVLIACVVTGNRKVKLKNRQTIRVRGYDAKNLQL